jgi:hypothetical protein
VVELPGLSEAETAAVAAAMQCLDDFMAAWNARDLKALEDTMNFPHVRLNNANALTTTEKGATGEEAFAKTLREAPSLQDWHHSSWGKREVVAASPDKVHIQTLFVRYRADNTVLGSFESLYVVTRENGRWGVRIRSSFAP